MAYFNHAFKKVFVATNVTATGTDNADITLAPGATTVVENGIITASGVLIQDIKDKSLNYGPGVAGLFDSKTNTSISAITKAPFYVAASAIKLNDKQGPFHGGYQESNKSKVVNPKYVRELYKVDGNLAKRSVLHIGATAYNLDNNADCAKTYVCAEDYNVRVDIKGSDALRFANHNVYTTLEANGGCCDADGVPNDVDAAVIMKQFFQRVIDNPIVSELVRPILDIDGTYYAYDQATATAEETASGLAPGTILLFADAPDVSVNGTSAGLILIGALVETKFKNCTFQRTDYFQVEPLMLYASEVDYNGEPCLFEGMCVVHQSRGLQPNGLGEEKLRELILAESYLQNFFSTDLRIREITQGDQMFDVIDRNAIYSSFYILHSVPRYNNPTGVFDNDQYLLEVVGSKAGIDELANDDEASGIFDAAVTAGIIDVVEIKNLTTVDTTSDALPVIP